MPHHHEGPGPHHPHGPHHGAHRGWITSARNETATSQEVGEYLIFVGQALVAGEPIEANDVVIKVADEVLFEFVYELNHHNNKVLRFHIEWSNQRDNHTKTSSTLRLAKVNRDTDVEDLP